MSATIYTMPSYPVTERDTTCCRHCCELIVWQTSRRNGKKYPTDAKKVGDEIHTARNWFHTCKQKAQLSLLPTLPPAPPEPDSKYEPLKDTKDEKRQAMRSCIETASESQLRRALEVIFNRQTLGEQQSNATTQDNSIGFTGLDAEILSSIYKNSKKYGQLRGRQVDLVRQKMLRYARQLVDALEKGEWTP